MPDSNVTDSTFWGGVGAAVIAGVVYIRKIWRADKTEQATTDVTLSLQGAQKVLYDTLKEQMESMRTSLTARIRELEQQLANYFQIHEDCQKTILRLENENAELRKNQKL